MNSSKEELEKFRKVNGPLIDVRSPSEYYKGHMPNSINIPLFDNEAVSYTHLTLPTTPYV